MTRKAMSKATVIINKVLEIGHNFKQSGQYDMLRMKLSKKDNFQLDVAEHAIKQMLLAVRDGDYEPILLEKITLNGKEITLVEWELLALEIGDNPQAKIVKVGDEVTIIVNNAWSRADKKVKEAIIAHEIGHLELGHLDDAFKAALLNYKRKFGSKEATQREIDADNFAVEQGHGDGLLYWMSDLQKQGVTSKELNTRFSNLLNN